MIRYDPVLKVQGRFSHVCKSHFFSSTSVCFQMMHKKHVYSLFCSRIVHVKQITNSHVLICLISPGYSTL